MRVLAAQTLVFSLLGACGGEVVDGATEPKNPLVPTLPHDVPVTPLGCSEPLLVPAGDAWLTQAVGMKSDTGALVLAQCPGEGTLETGTPVQRFKVRDVFLDSAEVTNACYAACVEDGACPAPSPLPLEPSWDDHSLVAYTASVVPDTAEAFCAWRGGRLPTMLELTRASHGDLLHVGNAELHEKLRRCIVGDSDGEGCDQLRNQHMHGQLPSGTLEADVGPFGHHDLFGGHNDITATVIGTDSERVCASGPGSVDPGTFGDNLLDRAYFRVFMAISFDDDVPSYTGNANIGNSDGSPSYETGVRCAYDPVFTSTESEGP